MMDEQKKLAIVVTQGTLDAAYPPFILGSTAAALGYEVQMYFTFYALGLLKRDLDLQLTPLGNPAMPISLSLPVVAQTLPGVQSKVTAMMQTKIKSKGLASIEELRDTCITAGVTMVACQMTIDLFDFKMNELINEIELGGAATFFEFAGCSDVSLSF